MKHKNHKRTPGSYYSKLALQFFLGSAGLATLGWVSRWAVTLAARTGDATDASALFPLFSAKSSLVPAESMVYQSAESLMPVSPEAEIRSIDAAADSQPLSLLSDRLQDPQQHAAARKLLSLTASSTDFDTAQVWQLDAADAENYSFTFNTSALFSTNTLTETVMPALKEKNRSAGFPATAKLRPNFSLRFHTPPQGGPFVNGFCDPEGNRYFLAGRDENYALQSFTYNRSSGTFTPSGVPAAIPNGANELVVDPVGNKAYVAAAASPDPQIRNSDKYLYIVDLNNGQTLSIWDMARDVDSLVLLRNNQRLLVDIETQELKYFNITNSQNITELTGPGVIGEAELTAFATIEDGVETILQGSDLSAPFFILQANDTHAWLTRQYTGQRFDWLSTISPHPLDANLSYVSGSQTINTIKKKGFFQFRNITGSPYPVLLEDRGVAHDGIKSLIRYPYLIVMNNYSPTPGNTSIAIWDIQDAYNPASITTYVVSDTARGSPCVIGQEVMIPFEKGGIGIFNLDSWTFSVTGPAADAAQAHFDFHAYGDTGIGQGPQRVSNSSLSFAIEARTFVGGIESSISMLYTEDKDALLFNASPVSVFSNGLPVHMQFIISDARIGTLYPIRLDGMNATVTEPGDGTAVWSLTAPDALSAQHWLRQLGFRPYANQNQNLTITGALTAGEAVKTTVLQLQGIPVADSVVSYPEQLPKVPLLTVGEPFVLELTSVFSHPDGLDITVALSAKTMDGSLLPTVPYAAVVNRDRVTGALTLTGTPRVEDRGMSTTLILTPNGQASAALALVMPVQERSPLPPATLPPNQAIQAGTHYSYQLSPFTHPDGGELTYTAALEENGAPAAWPAWLVFDGASGRRQLEGDVPADWETRSVSVIITAAGRTPNATASIRYRLSFTEAAQPVAGAPTSTGSGEDVPLGTILGIVTAVVLAPLCTITTFWYREKKQKQRQHEATRKSGLWLAYELHKILRLTYDNFASNDNIDFINAMRLLQAAIEKILGEDLGSLRMSVSLAQEDNAGLLDARRHTAQCLADIITDGQSSLSLVPIKHYGCLLRGMLEGLKNFTPAKAEAMAHTLSARLLQTPNPVEATDLLTATSASSAPGGNIAGLSEAKAQADIQLEMSHYGRGEALS